jgi:hypothetical protein
MSKLIVRLTAFSSTRSKVWIFSAGANSRFLSRVF